ncbi:reverse transcriptase domain-containing protein [Tanacetum coccineum]
MKSVRYGVSNVLDMAYWGFLRVGTTFDIFQNIHILYLQYGVLVFSGYGVLILFPLWSFGECRHRYTVSSVMDTAYWLSEHLTDEESLKEWTLYTDEALSLKGVGAGLVLIDLAGTEYTYAIRLTFPSTNNEAEYEALLADLRIAHMMKVQAVKVKVDSKLVACQLNEEFVASSEGMEKYLAKAKKHAALFKNLLIENIPQNQNQKADILSKLAPVAFNHLIKEVLVEVLNEKFVDAQEIIAVIKEEEDNWMTPIVKYLEEGVLSTDENKARTLWMKIK